MESSVITGAVATDARTRVVTARSAGTPPSAVLGQFWGETKPICLTLPTDKRRWRRRRKQSQFWFNLSAGAAANWSSRGTHPLEDTVGLGYIESGRRRCRSSSISVVTVEQSSRRFSVRPRPRRSIVRTATARGSRSCSQSSLSPEHRREPSRLKTALAAPAALRDAECAGSSPEPAASAR